MTVPARTRGALQARAERSYVARQVLLPVQDIIYAQRTGSVVLLGATAAAIVWANSPWSDTYQALWQTPVSVDAGPLEFSSDLRHWVDDALMALFFYVVGLEIKREVLFGHLSKTRHAILPLAAALGGMVLPALLYLALNRSGPGERGWGIPMATDIAFALGALALVGSRVPDQLRVLLLALAIVDDIGAIVVIAVFYTSSLSVLPLVLAVVLLGAIVLLARLHVRAAPLYVTLGLLVWFAVYQSGIHATIAGVALAFVTPANPYFSRAAYVRAARDLVAEFDHAWRKGETDRADALLGEIEEMTEGTESPLDRAERLLRPWSSYLVLPAFALGNAGVGVSLPALGSALANPVTQGVLLGLVVGKPLGIFALAWLAVRLKVAALPAGARWREVVGIGLVAGIGFTVSLFITGLAFPASELQEDAKVGILLASIVAGLAGIAYLRLLPAPTRPG